MRFITNFHCLVFLNVNIQITKHVHQEAHLAIYLNYSYDMLCLEYNLIVKDFGTHLHEQAPVHKSWRLMSELLANPNGHLQVINIIHGCQLTSHLNNHSLWNTNQTASPWYTDYFIPLIRWFIWAQTQQNGGDIMSPASHSTKDAVKPTNTHYAFSL